MGYCIIDILPEQVPAGDAGQYFRIEKFFLEQPQMEVIAGKFSRLLIKLNCYEDILVSRDEETWSSNPAPEDISLWMETAWQERKQLSVRLVHSDGLITFSGDDHYMTFYRPEAGILSLIRQLATSEGLFVWAAPAR